LKQNKLLCDQCGANLSKKPFKESASSSAIPFFTVGCLLPQNQKYIIFQKLIIFKKILQQRIQLFHVQKVIQFLKKRISILKLGFKNKQKMC
jgi:hypothetical protein